jgi:hypothetical protein
LPKPDSVSRPQKNPTACESDRVFQGVSNYFEEAGAGAGAGAAEGQQEAANSDATAATIAILTIFIFGCSVGCFTTGFPVDAANTNRS